MGVVFDVVVIVQFLDYFQVEGGLFFDVFGFEEVEFVFKVFFLFVQFIFNVLDDLIYVVFGGDVQVGRENCCGFYVFNLFVGFNFNVVNGFNFVFEENYLVVEVNIGQVDVNGIVFYVEGCLLEVSFGV